MAATCQEHNDRMVEGTCTTCGRYACDLCLVDINGVSYCKRCLGARVQRPARHVSGFMRLALSLAPGVGHMYLGLMNRGLQLMVLSVVGSMLVFAVHAVLFAFFITGVVFYSIFDAREAHLRMRAGENVPDVLLVNWGIFTTQRWVAYALVGLGVLGIYRALMHELLGWASVLQIPQFWRLVRAFEGSLMGALAILAGLWMLRRGLSNPGSGSGGSDS